MSSFELQWYCLFFFLWTFAASCILLTQIGSPILVVNFALVPHPHEIVCIYVSRTANTSIYPNPCFVSDEMNILLYFLSATFCLAFIYITHRIVFMWYPFNRICVSFNKRKIYLKPKAGSKFATILFQKHRCDK